MDVGRQLITYLKTLSAVTSLIGSGTSARIYQHDAKEGVQLPYVVVSVTSGLSAVHLATASGIAMNRVTITCYADNETDSYNLNSVIRRGPLLGYRGVMGTGYCNGVADDGGYESGYDPPIPGANDKRYWTMQHYQIWHKETTD